MIYLDNAATSRYVPKEVLRCYISECRRKSNAGRGGHNDSISSALKIQYCRETICNYFSMPDGETVFTKNCTEALNIAILGGYKGGHIVTTVTEHNSVLRPLNYLERSKNVEVSYVRPDKCGRVTVDRIRCALRADTRLVIINACSNVTGGENDFEEICRYCAENGIRTIVDASQIAGHKRISMNSIGCDILCSSGHKGLYGLQGTGFLVFNTRMQLRPIIFGGTGTQSISLSQPDEYPESLEAGTLNSAAIIALDKAIQWVGARTELIANNNLKYTELIISQLERIQGIRIYSKPNVSGIVAFIIDGVESERIADHLNYNGIAVRAGLHCAPLMHRFLGTINSGLVRISLGYDNTLGDIYTFLRAIERFKA